MAYDHNSLEIRKERTLDALQARAQTMIEAAEALRDEVAAAMDDHAAEKSDRWLEGEVGQQFQEWMTAWENSLDTIELNADDALQTVDVDFDVVETFLNLPLERDDA
jgi:uncharacterized protein YukE